MLKNFHWQLPCYCDVTSHVLFVEVSKCAEMAATPLDLSGHGGAYRRGLLHCDKEGFTGPIMTRSTRQCRLRSKIMLLIRTCRGVRGVAPLRDETNPVVEDRPDSRQHVVKAIRFSHQRTSMTQVLGDIGGSDSP